MIIDDKLMKYVVFQKRTVAEVRGKCNKLGYTEEYTDEIIAYLQENAYLNDEKYVEKYIQNVMRLKPASIYEMKIGLLKKGVKDEIIERYMNTNYEELLDFEYESAKKTVLKKYKQVEDFEKVKNYLKSKGYSYDSIKEGIDNCNHLIDNSNRE